MMQSEVIIVVDTEVGFRDEAEMTAAFDEIIIACKRSVLFPLCRNRINHTDTHIFYHRKTEADVPV